MALGGVEAADVPAGARAGATRPGAAPPRLPQVERPAYAVPAVPARPLNIDEGDRIQVAHFILDGAREHPEHAIDVSAIEALVESLQVARPEGFTVGRLQEVADAVTTYYRTRGLILAQAIIPVQRVAAGAVHIQILEGTLGRVLIEGNKRYKTTLLERPFHNAIGAPVTKNQIESTLLGLNQYPGLTLYGVFQPGQQVGSADLAVKVQEERRFEASVRADNHGIRETGQNRYRLEGVANNLTGGADRLTGTLQATAVPANSFYWGAEYAHPLPFRDLSASVRFDRNRFNVGGEFRDRDIESDTRNLFVTLEDQLIRARQRNLSARLELARKRAQTNIRARPQSRDDLSVLNLGLDFDLVDSRFAGLNAGLVEYSHGFNDFLGAMGETVAKVRPSRQGGDRRFAEGAFDKIFLSLSRLQSLTPLSEKLRQHSLLLRLEMQWSDDLLVPLEQYAVGGPTSVRAYQPTEFLFDRALFGSIEWIINAPGIADQPAFGNRTWGEIVQVSLFFDIAIGELNDPLASEDRSDNLSGAGISISANNPGTFTGKLSIATPVGRPQSISNHHPQYWIDLNFFF